VDWEVNVAKRAGKRVKKLPVPVVQLFEALLVDLMKMGPVQHEWPNYSKLTQGRYHCHLNYRFVAVWEVIDDTIRVLEVTYVGSREDAPY
jgi:mRNA-degrading endonuclease RelE of RelBE toxin-antitoxin system